MRDGEHRSTARLHLLYGRDVLGEKIVARQDDHRRRLRRHQGQRPVLELGGGIGLGVELVDLLELQRPFHGDGMARRLEPGGETAGETEPTDPDRNRHSNR